MTDAQLTTAAMLFELGVPTILAVALFIAPKLRALCYSVLGAISPLLFAYVSVVVSTWNTTSTNEQWALQAVWAMSFVPYLLALAVGLAMGFSSKPERSASRFSLAGVASIVVLLVFLFFNR